MDLPIRMFLVLRNLFLAGEKLINLIYKKIKGILKETVAKDIHVSWYRLWIWLYLNTGRNYGLKYRSSCFKHNIWQNDQQCNQKCRALMRPSDLVLSLVVRSYYEKQKAWRLAFCASKLNGKWFRTANGKKIQWTNLA